MTETIGLLAPAFAACLLFVGIHAYFGIHVLRRGVVFVDLALAQLSALGGTAAFALGHAPMSPAGYAYTLAFTLAGAAGLALIGRLPRWRNNEALIGILYVAATAMTVLIVDQSPQGAEHVKRMLMGSILTVDAQGLLRLAGVYAAIAVLQLLGRRSFLALSGFGGTPIGAATLWDFLFYASFGVVVTSSVATAGVLLVFSFLIVPAVIGDLYAERLRHRLAIGWIAGVLASAVGLATSVAADLPTGATVVTSFALLLALAALLRPLLRGGASARRAAVRGAALAALLALLAAALWLIVNPAGDQPLAAAIESVIGPERFLGGGEAEDYRGAAAFETRYRDEAARVAAIERASRWQGRGLAADEVRALGSYARSFSEMQAGERFVQDYLRVRARERERWWIGLPVAVLASVGLLLLWRRA